MGNTGDESYIRVTVKGQDGDTTCFQIGKEAKLEKLFKAYCEKKQIHLPSVRFLCKGNRIQPMQTALQAKLKEGSEIEAMLHMSGGSRGN